MGRPKFNGNGQKPKFFGQRYLRMPSGILDHQNYLAMSKDARILLTDIQHQFNGVNNGSLKASVSAMRKRGWTNKRALMNARRELEHYGFIEVTRQGGRNGPTLYALSYINIHAGVHHAGMTAEPSNNWAREADSYEKKYNGAKNPDEKLKNRLPIATTQTV